MLDLERDGLKHSISKVRRDIKEVPDRNKWVQDAHVQAKDNLFTRSIIEPERRVLMIDNNSSMLHCETINSLKMSPRGARMHRHRK